MNVTLSPGQASALEAIRRLARGLPSGGRTVFLAGEPGSGRSFLLAYATDALRSTDGIRIAAGGVSDGAHMTRTPSDRSGRADDLIRTVDSDVAAGLDLLGPEISVMRRILKASVAAQRLVAGLVSERRRLDVSDLLARTLRAAAAEGPLVCLVDDADRLDAEWWWTLRLGLADELAHDLPLLLVLAVDGPVDPSSPGDEDGSPACAAASSLVQRRVADWLALKPVGHADLTTWVGRSRLAVASVALEITGGRAGELAELWRGWERRGAVRRNSDGEWELGERGETLLAEAADSLSRRLHALLGGEISDAELDRARRVLGCAALEGRSFTAEAVAAALGLDPDEVHDLLDLLDPSEAETPRSRCTGQSVVRELGMVELLGVDRRDVRRLWRYRFVRSVEWRVARGWVDPEAESEIARRLANSITTAYGPDARRVALSVALLYKLAGDEGGYAHFADLAYLAASRRALASWARWLLAAEPNALTAWDCRDGARLLLHACLALHGTQPFETTLQCAEHAARLARSALPLGAGLEATALLFQGNLLRLLGRAEEARLPLCAARDLAREGAPRTLAQAYTQLAWLERDTGGGTGRELNEVAWRLYRDVGDERGEARCLLLLASIELEAGDHDAARVAARRALDLCERWEDRSFQGESWEDRSFQGTCLHRLGSIETAAGRLEPAREYTAAALEIKRELGVVVDEAECLRQLATIDLKQGDDASAHSRASCAYDLQAEIGHRRGQAAALYVLGKVAHARGESAAAIERVRRAERIYREIGDERGVMVCCDFLTKLDPG